MGCGGGAAESSSCGCGSAMRYVVSLPVCAKPEAPDVCLRCGRGGAREIGPRRVPTIAVGWSRGLWPPMFLPLLCVECGRSEWRRFWIEFWIAAAFAGVVVGAVFVFRDRLPQGWGWMLVGAGVLGIVLARGVRAVFSPTPVRCFATQTEVRYSFRNRVYALEFARVNHAEIGA